MLDTNVLMHDPTSLFRFEEHDVYLPMFTLEELDNHKKGMTEVARNARQVSRFLDELVARRRRRRHREGHAAPATLGNGRHRPPVPADRVHQRPTLPADAASGKADNQILGVVRHLQRAAARAPA